MPVASGLFDLILAGKAAPIRSLCSAEEAYIRKIARLQTMVTVPVMAPTPSPKYRAPKPLLRFHNDDLDNPGCVVFTDVFASPKDALHLAIQKVLSHLYPSHYSSDDGRADDAGRPWQEVRSITWTVVPNGPGLAATSGSRIDDAHKTIEFDAIYPQAVSDSPRLHDELMGVLVHEMVHCWQHNGHGAGPGGLIEGVADFVRLRAGYAPPHWKKRRSSRWDAGYETTGFFLDHIETTRGSGSVERINMALRQRYEETEFWQDLFGKNVEDLWREYQDTLARDEDESSPKR